MKVAHANDRFQAEMLQGLLEDGGIRSVLRPMGIDGPMVGVGLLPRASQQILVRADQVEAARRVLDVALVEQGQEAEPEMMAGAGHVDEGGGRKPRSYGVLGAYARAYLWSLCALGVAFAVFLLLNGT